MTFPKIPFFLAALVLAAFPAGAQAPGGEALVPLFGLLAGEQQAVTLSEADANALLESSVLAPRIEAGAGLTGLRVRFRSGEVEAAGRLAPSRLGSFGNLLVGPEAAPQPVELVFGLRGQAGMGTVTLRRVVISGMELPPAALEEALTPMLLAPFQEAGVAPPVSGEPFPLPYGLESVEVTDGALHLRAPSR